MIEPGHYHLVGVGGVGMSALAQALLAEGCRVSGSDRYRDSGGDSDVLGKLRSAGVRLVAQDGSGVSPETRAVVISTAIESENPDLQRARALRVNVIHRSRALAALVEGSPCIAITGTCGKSTVTGMTGWILECLGADPMVVNGAPILNWRNDRRIGNMRAATAAREDRKRPAPWVVEADESDRSLLNLHPDWAVITNVSKDHFSVEESAALFDRFRAQASVGVVSMLDEPDLVRAFDPRLTRAGSRFRHGDTEFVLRIPGRHNAENALCAIMLCEKLGYGLREIGAALAGFQGIERRLEQVGEAGGVTVVDDYAHNPTKIRASWKALSPYCRRLHAVWRPHGFGPLRQLMDELALVFGEVVRPSDRLFILPVYDAGGTADRGVNSDALVERLTRRGVPAAFTEEIERLPGRLAAAAAPGDVIMTMGARDPDLPRLARRILAACHDRYEPAR